MYFPDFKKFEQLAKKANVIPVYKEISADLDTPVSAFLKIAKGDYAFLLESVEGAEKIARYSFLGAEPSLVLETKSKSVRITSCGKRKVFRLDKNSSPLDEVKKIMSGFKAAEVAGLPRFSGGLVGYMGYDTVRFFEDIPDKNPDDLKLDDCVFMLTDTIMIFDHANHTIKIVKNVILAAGAKPSKAKLKKLYNASLSAIEDLGSRLEKTVHDKEVKKNRLEKSLTIGSNFKKSEFQNIVKAGKDYIRKGDIIQVVLSQRFSMKLCRSPFSVYRNLRSLNPSPYMFFLKLKDISLLGASPEMLARCEDGLLQTRPIAGTRRRGATDEEDARLARELINDKKERAEHLMLVDLGRNDLGRVSRAGNVEVSEFMKVEKYSHVMHLVSEVRGRLDTKKYDIYDALKAAFPAGTVSGSPKIRAMEIIDELENIRRGPYAGCVGYFSFSHNMDTCITIRTIVAHKDRAYIQAGAGIVADSVPEKEYFESMNKAKALIEAINQS